MITCPHCGGDVDDEFERPVEGPERAPTRVSAWANASSDDGDAIRAACELVADQLVEQCPDGFGLSGDITFAVHQPSDDEMVRRARSWALDHQLLHGSPPPPGMKAPRLVRVLGEAPIAMRSQPRSETTG